MQECRIPVPRPGIEPVPPAVDARSSNHWTAREFPFFLLTLLYYCYFYIWITYNKDKKRKKVVTLTNYTACFYTIFINLTEVVSQITQLRFHALKEKKDDLSMKKEPLHNFSRS